MFVVLVFLFFFVLIENIKIRFNILFVRVYNK